MKDKIWFVVLLVLLVMSITELGMTSDSMIFKDFESFKKSLYIGVSEKRKIDINNDGTDDLLVFSNGGEETFLTILIKKDDSFVATEVPVGLEYEILGQEGGYFLKVGIGTFPMFGDIQGPDKYNWYDFFRIESTKLVSINELHTSFYKKMLPIYEKRISEIEDEIESNRAQLINQGNDPETVDMMNGLMRDHIERYRVFIEQANKIIETSKKN